MEGNYNHHFAIFTYLFTVKAEHEIVGESNIADTILDHLASNSDRLELTGDSWRKKKKLKG